MVSGSTAFSAGLMLGLASILSVGPNNVMMMREGLRRGHVVTLASTVWASYCALILVAYASADKIDAVSPASRLWLSWMGLAALSSFSLHALLAATKAPIRSEGSTRPQEKWAGCVRRALVVVWCNPLSYVELLIIPASVCETFSAPRSRLEFISAMFMMAGLCCYGYGFGGGAFASFVRQERTIRAFDAASGVLLAGAAMLMGARLARATF